MAGYIVTLSDFDSLKRSIERGVYGTLMKPPTGYWRTYHEATFADFAGMAPDDDIYFFHARHVYGIGRLAPVNGAVAHANTEDAHVPEPFDASDELLLPSGDDTKEIRFFCTFQPAPAFFAEGVDMDDLLDSSPASFRMLRVLQNRSFVKVDDEENQALRNMILRRAFTRHGSLEGAPSFASNAASSHANLEVQLGPDHRLSAAAIIAPCADGDAVRHEMALEAGVIQQLVHRDAETTTALGQWDYVTHQVPASPFKPIAYMDFIDVFGYRYIPNYPPTVVQFLVAELKRGPGSREDVLQLLKYVDWVKSEYAAGDYGLITAHLVAYDFDQSALDAALNDGERRYIIGRRPAEPRTWRDLTLHRYRFQTDGLVGFEQVSS